MLETARSDVMHAFRMLRRSPVFTLVAVLVIALGSGAVTTVFSAMNALILRPLPGVADPAHLFSLERPKRDGDSGMQASYPDYEQLRDGAGTLDGLAAWSKVSLSIAARGEGSAVYGNLVSGNFFSVLGVQPTLGRFFLPEEDGAPLAHPVIVVSEGFWRTRLGADSTIVGQTVNVSGRPYTLVGVAPAGFHGVVTPIVADAWVPLAMQPQLRPDRSLERPDASWLWLFGRMKDGVSKDAVRAELMAITVAQEGARSAASAALVAPTERIQLSPMTGLPPDARKILVGFVGLLLGASVLVLLIASVNVAAMFSARAIARQREMAVRAALGAARGRLVRQLLTESLLLIGLGASGGLASAIVATWALERIQLPSGVPLALELSPDLRVLAFTLVLSLLTGVIVGLAPALRASRPDVTARLRSNTVGGGKRRSVVNDGLVVGQLALSLVLLVAAGLFLRAFDKGQRMDPGFDRAGVATVLLDTESWGYDEAKGRIFYGTLDEQLQALPGVTVVSSTTVLPLTMSRHSGRMAIDESAAGPGDAGTAIVDMASVGANYFAALRIPIVSGRPLDRSDDALAPPVVVVNETLARRLWPGESAVGRTITIDRQRLTVVGVARDASYSDLRADTPPFAYFPVAQRWEPDQTILVRTAGDPASLAPEIRHIVRSIDPAVPLPAVVTMERATSMVLLPQRVAAMVTGTLGLAGLLLATVGLYGIIAYSVSGRTRELGIRMALGARRADVLRMVVSEGMALAGLGVLAGLLLAVAATRLMAGLLLDVDPVDLPTFAGMSVIFVVVSLLASYLPARRAAGSDPVIALHAE